MTQFWRGMEDVHFKFPKHFLLDRCVYQSYQMLRLGYLYSVYIYICIYVCMFTKMYVYKYTYIETSNAYIHTYVDVYIHTDIYACR